MITISNQVKDKIENFLRKLESTKNDTTDLKENQLQVLELEKA